jgi:hypothetical protein
MRTFSCKVWRIIILSFFLHVRITFLYLILLLPFNLHVFPSRKYGKLPTAALGYFPAPIPVKPTDANDRIKNLLQSRRDLLPQLLFNYFSR